MEEYAAKFVEINEQIKLETRLPELMRQIRQAKQEWESTVDSLPQLVCLLDKQTCIIRANCTIERWNLGSVMDVKGKELHQLFHPDCSAPDCYLKAFLLRARQEVFHGRTADCEAEDKVLQRYVSIQFQPISEHQTHEEEKKSACFAVAIVSDISEQRQAEEALRQRNHELSLLNSLSDLLQACDDEKEMSGTVSRVCKQLFPLDSGCLCGMESLQGRLKVVDFWGKPPTDPGSFSVKDCLVLQQTELHARGYHNTQTLCSHFPLCPASGYLCVPIRVSDEIMGILTLRSDRNEHDCSTKEYREMIKSQQILAGRVADHYALSLSNLRLREHDPLTGLYNRRYMDKSLKCCLEHRNTSILMIDIDHFSLFNDSYGHEAGDLVLEGLGAFLHTNVRSDDIACRYGGEEFLLILSELSLEGARQRAEELRLGVKNLRIAYRGNTLNFTISIGVAGMPGQESDIMDVVKSADTALYQAKKNGRDQVVVNS